LRRHGGYRVLGLNNPFNDTRISYFHRSLGGYHGAKLKRYQELIEFQIGPAMQRVGSMLQSGTSMPEMDSLLAKEGVLNMLNTRYLIYNPERPPIRNTNAYGPAWFVDEVKWVKNADEEIIATWLHRPIATTALIDERYRAAIGSVYGCTGPIRKRGADHLRHQRTHLHRAFSQQGGVVVFSEIWYGPDWHATVDDKSPAEHVACRLRPACDRRARWRTHGGLQDRQQPFNTSRPVALASSVLVLLLVDGCVVLGMA
jgi:hypothetical protein